MLFAVTIAFVAFGVSARAQDASHQTTLTGVVSDPACGAHHSMKGMSAADCTRMCVKAGQSYALVVGQRVYTLSGHSAELSKNAGQRGTVKGILNANTLAAETVKPAK